MEKPDLEGYSVAKELAKRKAQQARRSKVILGSIAVLLFPAAGLLLQWDAGCTGVQQLSISQKQYAQDQLDRGDQLSDKEAARNKQITDFITLGKLWSIARPWGFVYGMRQKKADAIRKPSDAEDTFSEFFGADLRTGKDTNFEVVSFRTLARELGVRIDDLFMAAIKGSPREPHLANSLFTSNKAEVFPPSDVTTILRAISVKHGASAKDAFLVGFILQEARAAIAMFAFMEDMVGLDNVTDESKSHPGVIHVNMRNRIVKRLNQELPERYQRLNIPFELPSEIQGWNDRMLWLYLRIELDQLAPEPTPDDTLPLSDVKRIPRDPKVAKKILLDAAKKSDSKSSNPSDLDVPSVLRPFWNDPSSMRKF